MNVIEMNEMNESLNLSRKKAERKRSPERGSRTTEFSPPPKILIL